MKTSLEDKIRTHLEAFDDQLPPEGHLERFVEKLYESEQKNWQRRTFRTMMVAMAAVIAIALVFHFALPTSTQQESERGRTNNSLLRYTSPEASQSDRGPIGETRSPKPRSYHQRDP